MDSSAIDHLPCTPFSLAGEEAALQTQVEAMRRERDNLLLLKRSRDERAAEEAAALASRTQVVGGCRLGAHVMFTCVRDHGRQQIMADRPLT